ncbi:MAG TPA: DUF4956 domain-containing protein, partial [Vicinamibacteria bacterium]|nr:DUF4956 domain-containing protein [Vicinamibacteria bacterium]
MTWDSLVAQLFQPSDTVLFGFFDVVTAMVVSTLLCLMLAHIYRITHRGTSYSQSFLVTMMLMGVTTAVVMMIIGSNIARAFSLVGALSIIRFRTAMKDPRDTGFLFASMVAGMGCGTMFYMPAIALTIFVSVLALLLYHFDFGVKQRLESVIHVTFAQSPGAEEKIEAELKDRFPRVKLINRIMDFGDGRVTNVYVVRPSSLSSFEDAEDQLKNLNGVVRLA